MNNCVGERQVVSEPSSNEFDRCLIFYLNPNTVPRLIRLRPSNLHDHMSTDPSLSLSANRTISANGVEHLEASMELSGDDIECLVGMLANEQKEDEEQQLSRKKRKVRGHELMLTPQPPTTTTKAAPPASPSLKRSGFKRSGCSTILDDLSSLLVEKETLSSRDALKETRADLPPQAAPKETCADLPPQEPDSDYSYDPMPNKKSDTATAFVATSADSSASPDPSEVVLEVDAQGAIMRVISGYAFGYRAEQLVGHSVLNLVVHDDRTTLLTTVQALLLAANSIRMAQGFKKCSVSASIPLTATASHHVLMAPSVRPQQAVVAELVISTSKASATGVAPHTILLGADSAKVCFRALRLDLPQTKTPCD